MLDKDKLELVGNIGVDAGLCWVGDPCYILHRKGKQVPTDIGTNWVDFCNRTPCDKDHWQFKYNLGHEGLGVCVSTGYGDGFYPVYVERNAEGRIARLVVEFIPDEDPYVDEYEYDDDVLKCDCDYMEEY